SGVGELVRYTDRPFDRILLLDTLEHLRNPVPLLEDVRRLLAPRGKVIVSVPNAVNFTVRLMILFGHFHYQDRGILDWRHLRFFTSKTIRGLLEKHGFRVTGRQFTIVPLERVLPMRPQNRALRLMNSLLHLLTSVMPSLLAYEVVLTAER
ncbi:MAG: methyltransferase domain-containing protein, partial [Acidobacteriaceae bacterium]|nr:methyltransferase domain-containing protein [Acidobacteriaceae bacterium]